MKTRARAQSITELLVGLIALIPVILILCDIGTLIIGSAFNSELCRDAARAAANGPPSAIANAEPKKRAEAVVSRKRAQCAGNISINSPILVWETVRDPLPAKPFGGQVDGEVTVQTSVTVHPPFLVAAIVPNGVELKAKQTYPITWVMASDDLIGNSFTTGGNSGSAGNSDPTTTTTGMGAMTTGGGHQTTGGGTGGSTGGGGVGDSTGGGTTGVFTTTTAGESGMTTTSGETGTEN